MVGQRKIPEGLEYIVISRFPELHPPVNCLVGDAGGVFPDSLRCVIEPDITAGGIVSMVVLSFVSKSVIVLQTGWNGSVIANLVSPAV